MVYAGHEIHPKPVRAAVWILHAVKPAVIVQRNAYFLHSVFLIEADDGGNQIPRNGYASDVEHRHVGKIHVGGLFVNAVDVFRRHLVRVADEKVRFINVGEIANGAGNVGIEKA